MKPRDSKDFNNKLNKSMKKKLLLLKRLQLLKLSMLLKLPQKLLQKSSKRLLK
jgi:hypothetical protein